MENKRFLAPTVDTSGDFSLLEHCCTLNCVNNSGLCPRLILIKKFKESETFEDSMKVFVEMKVDNHMRPVDRPKVFREAITILRQRAKTADELREILNEFPIITTPTLIDFDAIKGEISWQIKTLESKK